MIPFLTPRYLSEAKAILKATAKHLAYNRDLMPAAEVARIEEQMRNLEHAIKSRNPETVEHESGKFEEIFSKHFPPHKHAGWRENCEVFLVAIVIAVGVRTYFLQPFTIPTGSMQPTLNGIVGVETNEPAPNLFVRLAHLALYGRSYIDVVAKNDGRVTDIKEKKLGYFLIMTDIQCEHASYRVWAPCKTITDCFHIDSARVYHTGDVIARGYVDAGDHVFVDKVSYNFRKPARGEVFVFKTTDIPKIEADLKSQKIEGSQFYIKRLAGLPNDYLRVDAPNLFINGAKAGEFGFERVMNIKNEKMLELIAHIAAIRKEGRADEEADKKDEAKRKFDEAANLEYFQLSRVLAGKFYCGYSNHGYLSNPETVFHVPSQSYFAMGDNSYNSSDSRYWGIVPEQNIAGRGLFVYWPFLPHWGLIR